MYLFNCFRWLSARYWRSWCHRRWIYKCRGQHRGQHNGYIAVEFVTHLWKKLFEKNAHNQVWGRYKATTRLFREEQKTEVIRQACVGLKQGRHDSEKVIYKIPDGRTKYIQRLCLQCQQTSHTSTSCSSRILGEHKMRYGVWRPNACRVSVFLFF